MRMSSRAPASREARRRRKLPPTKASKLTAGRRQQLLGWPRPVNPFESGHRRRVGMPDTTLVSRRAWRGSAGSQFDPARRAFASRRRSASTMPGSVRLRSAAPARVNTAGPCPAGRHGGRPGHQGTLLQALQHGVHRLGGHCCGCAPTRRSTAPRTAPRAEGRRTARRSIPRLEHGGGDLVAELHGYPVQQISQWPILLGASYKPS